MISIIIPVNASKKETLLDIRQKFPKVRWIYYDNKTGKKITIPEQRNLGIKKCKGDLIAFIDADCIPDKNWLVELYSCIEEGEEYVTGKVLSVGISQFYDSNWEKFEKMKYRQDAGSANTLFNKKIIEKVGYYDENFDYGSDVEFSWRVVDAGYKIRYNPKAIMHDNWGGFKTDIKRALRWGKARPNLYRKHPNRLSNVLKFNSDLYTLYSLGFFFYVLLIPVMTFIWPYYPLLLLIPLIKNIKINPFKKMVFDWFWGLGIIAGLINLIFKKEHHDPNTS